MMDYEEDKSSEQQSVKSVQILKKKKVKSKLTADELKGAFKDREIGFRRMKDLAINNFASSQGS